MNGHISDELQRHTARRILPSEQSSLPVCLLACLLSSCLSACLSAFCLTACLSFPLAICLSVCLSLCRVLPTSGHLRHVYAPSLSLRASFSSAVHSNPIWKIYFDIEFALAQISHQALSIPRQALTLVMKCPQQTREVMIESVTHSFLFAPTSPSDTPHIHTHLILVKSHSCAEPYSATSVLPLTTPMGAASPPCQNIHGQFCDNCQCCSPANINITNKVSKPLYT